MFMSGSRVERMITRITIATNTSRIGPSSASMRCERVLDLRVVGVGELAEHRGQLARRLADRDHVRDQRRELAARAHLRGDRGAARDRLLHAVDGARDHGVRRHAARDLERARRCSRRRRRASRACARSARSRRSGSAARRSACAASARPRRRRPRSVRTTRLQIRNAAASAISAGNQYDGDDRRRPRPRRAWRAAAPASCRAAWW